MRLSFCIATRNRADLLRETLENIVRQCPENVEIVIVDGASEDGTPAVVAAFQERFSRITYQRQETNGGVDLDYAEAVARATGDYCWLMTDDDVLVPGAVDTVLTTLAGDPFLVIVNGALYDLALKRSLDPSRLGKSKEQYEPHEQDALLADTGFYLTFIGGVVIRRDAWLSRDPQRYFGTGFLHLGVIFQTPLPGIVKVIREPLIRIRHGNISWGERAFTIWMFTLPQLIWSFDHLSEAVRQRVTPREPWRSVRNLLIYRALGAYGWREYGRLIRPRARGTARLVAALVALLPGIPLNLAAVLYCRLSRSAVPLLSLQTSRFHVARLVANRRKR